MWFADFLFVTLAKNGAVWLVLLIQKKTAMYSSAHWIWNSYRFLHSTRPAELLLISQFLCGSVSQYALRMFSQCSLLMGWFTSSYFGDAHTKAPERHMPRSKERKTCSARKQVRDQTGLTESLWCLSALEICFTYSTLTALPLYWMWVWWIFQKLVGSCHTNIWFL